MTETKLVAPFTASCDNHQRILALVRRDAAPSCGPPRVLQVPVRLALDVREIVSQNDRQMPESGAADPQDTHGAAGAGPGGNSDPAAAADAEEDPRGFVDLASFQPRNRLEQVCTVFLQDFPALRPCHVARALAVLLQAWPAEAAAGVRFAAMAESINDTRGVFVRFPSVQMARWAQALVPRVFRGVTAIFDDTLSTLAAPDPPEQVAQAALAPAATDFSALVANKTLYSSGSARSGTEDLDEVMQYYRTYKVENLELVEVPRELKEAIVRDIIRFRAKVLTLERDARKKEIERERRKAKRRLTLIFEDIRASAASDASADQPPAGDDARLAPTDSGAARTPDPLDALSDADYEAHVLAEAEQRRRAQYEAEHARLRALEQQEQAVLVERLHAARAYEQALVENKLAHMDDYKSLQDLNGSAAASASFASAGLDRLRLYYADHSEYLRVRSHERAREEAMDDQDRKDERESQEKAHAATPAFAAVKVVDSRSVPAPAASSGVVVGSLSEASLAAIKEKIAGLVEEFLGIREDLLIDFIYDFVLENNLSRGDDLVTELQETLDDDSHAVVHQLHEFVATVQ